MTLNYGWALLKTSTIKIACKSIEMDVDDPDLTVDQMPADDRITIAMGYIARTFYLVDCYFKSQADTESLLANFKTYNADTSPFKFEWQTKSDVTKFKIDGTSATSTTVYFKKISRIRCKTVGGNSIWYSPLVILVEA